MNFDNLYVKSESKYFDKGLMEYMTTIYKNMSIAFLISAFVAYLTSHSPVLMRLFFANPFMRLVVMFAPLIFTFYFYKSIWTATIDKARSMLFIFAGLMGVSLSTIFLAYTGASILQTFLTTAGTFGCMSLYGYKTKKDLTSLNSFLIMGLVGLLIASIVNIFVKSAQFDFILSGVGVIIFTLFTAYDVQKIKETYNYVGVNSDMIEKVAVIGSLQLYMDFVNLFLYLLRFFGNSQRD